MHLFFFVFSVAVIFGLDAKRNCVEEQTVINSRVCKNSHLNEAAENTERPSSVTEREKTLKFDVKVKLRSCLCDDYDATAEIRLA